MRVVVLGGGYGGLRAVEKLADHADIELTLVDANTYHFLQTEVYGYIAGTKEIDELAVDLQSWCRGFKRPVRFVQKEVTGLDTGNRRVLLGDKTLPYDILIVATGARTRFPTFIEGLREHSFGVKQLRRAFGFRHRFEEEVAKKLEGEDGRVRIVVAGAGLSGVEVAAEMAYMLGRYAKTLGRKREELEVILVDACETILPGMHSKIVEAAGKRLRKLGVVVKTGVFIERVEATRIHFKNGETLPYTFMIFTGGIVANTAFVADTFATNTQEQLTVNATLNLPGHPEIYAIGDCADIRDLKGRPLPPTAQLAEKSAEYAASAILARSRKRSPAPFVGRMDGMFIALGGRYGAAEIFGFRFHGLIAYYLKRLVTLIYFLGIHLRANTAYKIRA